MFTGITTNTGFVKEINKKISVARMMNVGEDIPPLHLTTLPRQ